MISKEGMDIIPSLIKETLQSMALPCSDVFTEEVAGQKVYRVATADSKLLIGIRGETLRAFEQVVKKMAEHKGVTDTHYMIDVDGYRVRHIEEIQQKAKVLAERAKSFEYDVEMPPMSSYERLIVHATLSGIPHITTESRGDGKDRRVVIRFAK